jgi:hypothetical protein
MFLVKRAHRGGWGSLAASLTFVVITVLALHAVADASRQERRSGSLSAIKGASPVEQQILQPPEPLVPAPTTGGGAQAPEKEDEEWAAEIAMLKAMQTLKARAKKRSQKGEDNAANPNSLLETQTKALLPGILKHAKRRAAELSAKALEPSSNKPVPDAAGPAESFDSLFAAYAAPNHPSSASNLASIESGGDVVLESLPTKDKKQQEEDDLRRRIAIDIFGPGIAALMDEVDKKQREGQYAEAATAEALLRNDNTTASLAAAASLFMEMNTNLMARGFPGLSMILKPVMNGVMKPVLKVAINMLTPDLMENVNENLQARMVAQLPADVAKQVSNKGGPALSTALADSLAATLSKSISAAVTRTMGLKLRDSIPDAVSPRVVTAITRKITDTVVSRLTPLLVKSTKSIIATNLASILMRSVSQAVTSTLSMVLNPLHFPPNSAQEGELRRVQCEVCEVIRSGGSFDGTISEKALSMLASIGIDSTGVSSSVACYLCEKGTAQERNLDSFVTQQSAHYHSEYYSRYYSKFYDDAMKKVEGKNKGK